MALRRTTALDAAHKEALLQEIRKRFVSRKFIAEIVVIPDYYLQGKAGFRRTRRACSASTEST